MHFSSRPCVSTLLSSHPSLYVNRPTSQQVIKFSPFPVELATVPGVIVMTGSILVWKLWLCWYFGLGRLLWKYFDDVMQWWIHYRSTVRVFSVTYDYIYMYIILCTILDDDVGFGALQTRRWMPTFRRNILSPSSGVAYRHFGTEDGDTIFLRNVGIYWQVYTAPKPTSSSLIPQWIPQISNCTVLCTWRSGAAFTAPAFGFSSKSPEILEFVRNVFLVPRKELEFICVDTPE
jgi:hypothetical protein